MRILLLAGLLCGVSSHVFGQTQLITNGGFELGNSSWAFSGLGANVKQNPSIPHSGQANLVMGNISSTNQAVSQTIKIPTNTVVARLRYFYNIYSTFNQAEQQFTVAIHDGTAFTTVATLSGLNSDPAQNSANYHQVLFDLTPFAGKTIQVTFFAFMGAFGGSTFFNVDDVSVLAVTTADLPPNDHFTNRITLTGNSNNIASKNLFASKEPGEPNHANDSGGGSVWWTWTAPTNGTLQLASFSTNFNTLLAAYTGSSVSNLTRIGSANAGSASDHVSRVNIPVFTGTEYQIAVDGDEGGSGNFILQMKFQADTNGPVVKINSPLPGQKVTNSTIVVRGTATDEVAVAAVQFRLENAAGTNGYQVAEGTNQWTANLTGLIPGTNIVRVIAHDINGIASAEVTRSFNLILVAPLTVLTTGIGTVSPNYHNALLEIGRAFSITAKPGVGYVFSNWTGGVTSKNPVLSFVMESNLVLQANFIPNPFVAGKGGYAGLFYEPGHVAFPSAGFFWASVTDKGSFSSKWLLAGATYSLSGQLAVDGSYSNALSRPNLGPLLVQLQIDLNGGDTITGTISDGSWTSDLTANRAVYSKTAPVPAPFGGRKFTLVLPGSDDFANEPGGHGFGSLSVATAGNLGFKGTLGDGTKVTQKTFLSGQNQWPFFASLYSKKGLVLGWLTFDTNPPAGDLGGPVSWIKQAQPTSKLYPAGFTNETAAVGSLYTFSNGIPILTWTNGNIILSGGNLADSITNAFTIAANNKVTGTNGLTLSFVTSSGLFKGSVRNPAAAKPIPVNGALLQKQDTGFGTFLGTNQTGQVFLGP